MKHLVLAAALLALPAMAAASTVNYGTVGATNEGIGTLQVGATDTINFSVTGPVTVTNFSILGSGFSAADLGMVTFGFTSIDNHYTDITPRGRLFDGTGTVADFVVTSDFALVIMANGSATASSYLFAFDTLPYIAAEVPLPASAGLLIAALAGAGAVARKRKGQAA